MHYDSDDQWRLTVEVNLTGNFVLASEAREIFSS